MVWDPSTSLSHLLLELLPNSLHSNHIPRTRPPPQSPVTCCSFLLEGSFPDFCKAHSSLPSSLCSKASVQRVMPWPSVKFHILPHPIPFLCLIFLFFPLTLSNTLTLHLLLDRSFLCLCRFTFSRMSYKWNHIVYSLFCVSFLSLSTVHWDSSMLLHVSVVPLFPSSTAPYGYTTVIQWPVEDI